MGSTAGLGVPIGLAIAVLLALVGTAPARANEDDGVSSGFMRGSGVRALSLGGAFCAIADDASGWMWNPAGLGSVTRTEFQTSQGGSGELDTREYFAGFVLPNWRWGAVSASYRQFGVSGIEGRDDRNALTADDLSDRESEATLGYGRAFGNGWNLGGIVKMRSQELAGRSANGAGLDLGFKARPAAVLGLEDSWMERLSVGVAIQNVVRPALRLDAEEVPDPTSTRIGFALEPSLFGSMPAVAALDIEKTQGRSPRLHAGVQVRVHPLMDLRFGMTGTGTTAGAGLRYGGLTLDYAFEDSPIAPEHQIGVSMRFGMSTDDSRAAYKRERESEIQSRMATAFEEIQAKRVLELADKARHAHAQGEYDVALEAVTTLLALQPADSAGKTLEGMILRDKAAQLERDGDLAPAAVMFGQALMRTPGDSIAAQGLQRCRAASDDRAARSAMIRDAFAKALEAYTADDLPAARNGFRAVLELEPQDQETRAMLGRVERTIKRREDQLIAQAERLGQAGLLDDAQAQLDQARALDPAADGLSRAVANLAQLRQVAPAAHAGAETSPRAPSAAARTPRRTLSEHERSEIAQLYKRGMAALQAGRSDEAIQYLELVRSRDADNKQAAQVLNREYLTRGLEAFAAGRLNDAVGWWEKALAADPTDPRTRAYLTRAQEHIAHAAAIAGQ